MDDRTGNGGSSADLVLVGADVYTLDPRRPWATAVAVRAGAISYVGDEAGARELVGRRTEVLNLPGSLVLPGFQDAHCHPASAGRDRLRIDLRAHHDAGAYRAVVAEYARTHPDEPVLAGSGWSMDAFAGGNPRRELLDDLVPDRPVFLMNRDGHDAWLNGAALALGGITKDTPDPWDGRIERNADGSPTGALHEGAATRFRDSYLPPATDAVLEAALLESQRYLHSLGITALQDANVSPQLLAVYRSMAERDLLTMKVVASLWYRREEGVKQVEALAEQRRWGTFGPIDAGTVKIMVDGILENGSAAVHDHYLDGAGRSTGGNGTLFLEPDELAAAVRSLDAEGFQVHFHAIGERAVQVSLDACEAARHANGRRDARHHVAHLELIAPGDVPRFAALDVVANCQPLWACSSPQVMELTVPVVGEERAGELYRFGDLERAGAMLAFGSDWGVSSPDPLVQLEVATTRVSPHDRAGEPLLAGQRLTLASAVEAFTLGSALVNRREDVSGSIEIGKAADLAVVDRNLFDGGAGPIGEAAVDLTVAGGVIVYARL